MTLDNAPQLCSLSLTLATLFTETKYYFYKIYLSLRKDKLLEEVDAIKKQDPRYLTSIAEQLDDQELNWLAENLRRIPYWLNGHINFAEISFRRNDIEACYASAQAALQLSPQSKKADKINHLLARTLLRSGSAERAIRMLQELIKKDPNKVIVREDLAAAYLALGQSKEAWELISNVEAGTLSHEGMTVFNYLKNKNL